MNPSIREKALPATVYLFGLSVVFGRQIWRTAHRGNFDLISKGTIEHAWFWVALWAMVLSVFVGYMLALFVKR